MSLTVTVTGLEHRIRFDWPAAAAAWAAEVSPVATAALRAMAPVGKGLDPRGPKPGGLRDSLGARTETAAGSVLVVLYSTAPYAGFVVGGTKPHVIMPRNARVLAWTDAGGQRFARKVNHPGTKPNPFPERAIGPLRPLLMARFARAAREAMIT